MSASAAALLVGAITQVVLLGTGTPAPDPEHSGPATAVVVDETPYLVDFGTGVVRRAAGAVAKGVSGLRPGNLQIAFVTHLHADHTMGYADLIVTRSSPDETHRCRCTGRADSRR